MKHGNGSPNRFRLVVSGAHKHQIEAMGQEAISRGQFDEFSRTMAYIEGRIQNDPRDFGELVNKLHEMDLDIHVCIVRPIIVYFGIHEVLPLVFLREIRFFTEEHKYDL